MYVIDRFTYMMMIHRIDYYRIGYYHTYRIDYYRTYHIASYIDRIDTMHPMDSRTLMHTTLKLLYLNPAKAISKFYANLI
jgi:hypothetical protein